MKKRSEHDPERPETFSELLTQSIQSHDALKTGWPGFDSSAMNIRPGELVLVAGRTGHGKTHLLLNLLCHWMNADRKGHFLYYSFEMPPQAMARRIETIIKARGEWPVGLKAKLNPWVDWDKRLAIQFKPVWDIDRLCSDAFSHVDRGEKVSAIFIDPLTAISPGPGGERDRRRDLELSLVSRKLKDLAHRLSCPVLAAVPSRLLRPEDDGGRLRKLLGEGAAFLVPEVEDAIRARRPRLEHFSEHGLEQEADLVLGLLNFLADYQEEIDPETRQVFKKQHNSIIELAAMKNRFGALESAELDIELKSGWIRDPLDWPNGRP